MLNERQMKIKLSLIHIIELKKKHYTGRKRNN